MPAFIHKSYANNYFIQGSWVLPVLFEGLGLCLLHKQKMTTPTTINAMMSRMEPVTAPAIKPEKSDS